MNWLRTNIRTIVIYIAFALIAYIIITAIVNGYLNALKGF